MENVQHASCLAHRTVSHELALNLGVVNIGSLCRLGISETARRAEETCVNGNVNDGCVQMSEVMSGARSMVAVSDITWI